MKRFLLAFSVLAALVVHAGPRPYSNITVVHNTNVYTVPFTVDTLLLQCPGGAVRYRTFTADECAAQDGGAQADGGAFGPLVDFSSMSDPMPIVRSLGQTCVGILGYSITDGGSLVCSLSTP